MLGLLHHLRELRREGGRIVMTTLGVVWGTLAVTILVAFTESMSQTVIRGEMGLGKGIFVVRGSSTSEPFAGLPAGRPIRLTSQDVDAVAAGVEAIREISREYTLSGVELSFEGRTHNVSLAAVDPPYAAIRNCPPQPGGRFINGLDVQRRRRVVFLGNQVKEDVFAGQHAIGRTVLIRGTPFTVVGVLEPKLQMASYQGQDNGYVFMPSTTFQSMWQRRYISDFVYRIPDRATATRALGEVYRMLGRRHRFDPKDESALNVWDTAEGQRVTENVHLAVRVCMGIIGVVTLIVAGVGVANVMYAMVKGRTREIGIKLAVGAKPRDITIHHLMEGCAIVVFGGSIGLLITWMITVVLDWLPMTEEALLHVGRPHMSAWSTVVVVVLLGTVALCAGYLPARRAASTDPAEALRYE